MKILINTQYFWPETFRINDVVKFLQEKGYSIDIVTGEPNYPDGKLFLEYINNKKNSINFITQEYTEYQLLLEVQGDLLGFF